MKTCLVITGGTIDYGFAGSFLKKYAYDLVLAVDGGLAAVEALGLTPDVIVGDFDTVKPELLAVYRQKPGICWEEHNSVKDETDTELAFRTAHRLGCDRFLVLGATGGRMDHALGNIHLLYGCLKNGVQAFIADEKNLIYLLNQGKTFHKEALFGTYISFLPLTEEVHGITLTGFRYPLLEKDISIGTSLCISNELSEEQGGITFHDGVLICVESQD